MHCRTVTALALACSLASPAAAAWFARTDSGGKLVITGVASNPDMTTTAVYLTCSGDKFDVEVLTVLSANEEELADYRGTKIVLGYETEKGEDRKMGLNGEPIISAGGALSIRATLDSRQSALLYTSISRGNRLDVELIHPELTDDKGIKKVFAAFWSTMTLALVKACPALDK